jgi:myo-inositol 2-dehydrogenase/D-chiro-inositol 1-dehydrogenase
MGLPEVIRYGLIGAGMMGREHLRNIRMTPGSEITAIADPNAQSRTLAAECVPDTARLYDTIDALLASKSVDALVIATPNDTHADVLAKILDRGLSLPILLEKPACTSTEQLDWMSSALAGYSAPLWIGMEYRYMPPVTQLVNEVRKGTVGDLKMISLREHRFPFQVKVGNWNRYAVRTGGTLVEKCCHFFDLMRLIAGDEAVRVYASAGVDVNHADERREDGERPDIIDNAFVTVDFRSGIRASLDLCMFAEGALWQEEFAATGSLGRVECFVPGYRGREVDTHSEIEISLREAGKQPERRVVEVDAEVLHAGAHHGATYYAHKKFREAILGTGPVEVTLQDGLKAVAIGLAAERSAKEKRVVALDGLSLN